MPVPVMSKNLCSKVCCVEYGFFNVRIPMTYYVLRLLLANRAWSVGSTLPTWKQKATTSRKQSDSMTLLLSDKVGSGYRAEAERPFPGIGGCLKFSVQFVCRSFTKKGDDAVSTSEIFHNFWNPGIFLDSTVKKIRSAFLALFWQFHLFALPYRYSNRIGYI